MPSRSAHPKVVKTQIWLLVVNVSSSSKNVSSAPSLPSGLCRTVETARFQPEIIWFARIEDSRMLSATQKEIEQVTEYMRSQAPDLTVEFVQKVYSENVLHVRCVGSAGNGEMTFSVSE